MFRQRATTPQIKGLKELAQMMRVRCIEATVVEIGSYAGESAEIIAPHVGRLYCVDPWKPYRAGARSSDTILEAEKAFDKVVTRHRNIEKMKMTSAEAAQLFDAGSIDWVYIDGDHSYASVMLDIQLWLPKCRVAIAGHDYTRVGGNAGVKKAVDRLLGKPDKLFSDQSWVKWIEANENSF